MNVLYLLVPIAILVAGGFVVAFFWAIKNGEFEDMDGPPVRILMDDD